MRQPGLFDWQTRLEQLDQGGDPLVRLNAAVDWDIFRPVLAPVRDKERLSNAGRKPYDLIVMFKVLLLQTLYNLSIDQTEYQIRDRLSFMRFLGLSLGDAVPDANTIWQFRETLEFLEEQGYREHIQRKGYRDHPLPKRQQQGNLTRARIRARVEHVFGGQSNRIKILLIRVIGRVRATAVLGLRNLAYNLMRYEYLVRD